MKGMILTNRPMSELTTEKDHGVLRLLEAGKQKHIDLQIVAMNQIDLVVTREDKKSIIIDGKVTKLPDFVIPRTGSGTSHYGLAVIRQLEHLGVCLCNKALGIEAVKDKLHMHQLLAHSSLPTPKTMLGKFPVDIEIVKREIGFPLIIKNTTGSFGAGIYLCENAEKFEDVMELLYSNNPNANIILQEFISKSSGTDLRVFVLGGRVIGCMQRTSSGSFKANYSRGGSVQKFDCLPELEWLALEAVRLVDLDIAGVDILFDSDGFKVCEVNSAPDFKGMEQATSQDIASCILEYAKIKAGAK